ncbi:hypothetical protein V8C35DRAFT_56396 [Trichoderma chlorosporum]
MQPVNVSLPNLHLVSFEHQMEFLLESSMQLRFPDGADIPKTGSDLLKLVTEKHLWIARTGSCHLQLDVSIQGELVTEGGHLARVGEWVRDHEVWSRMGVCLHAQDRDTVEPPGKILFSIQHPDLSSALITRKDAFIAEFESVSCHINISPKKREPSVKKHSSKRKLTETSECTMARQPDDVLTDDEHLVHLSLDDQRVIDAFIQSLNMMPAQEGRGNSPPRSSQSDSIGERLEFSERLKQLFEVALGIFVLGSRKKHKGIAAVDCTHAECLTQLAPGVFDMPYLKTISDRASLLPIIANSLARMKTAESPILRQKAASFAARVTDVTCDPHERVIRGIEKSTWDVLLSTIKIPTWSQKGGHNTKRATPKTVPKPATGPDNSPLTVEKEERGDVTVMLSPDADGATENHSAKEPNFPQLNHNFPESHQGTLPETQTSSAASLPGPCSYDTRTEWKCIYNSLVTDDTSLTAGMSYEQPFMVDAAAWSHEPWLMEVGSLTFDEWLCSSESAAEKREVSCGNGNVDVKFYKS